MVGGNLSPSATNFIDRELTQCRVFFAVNCSPWNTCPRCPPQFSQRISVRRTRRHRFPGGPRSQFHRQRMAIRNHFQTCPRSCTAARCIVCRYTFPWTLFLSNFPGAGTFGPFVQNDVGFFFGQLVVVVHLTRPVYLSFHPPECVSESIVGPDLLAWEADCLGFRLLRIIFSLRTNSLNLYIREIARHTANDKHAVELFHSGFSETSGLVGSISIGHPCPVTDSWDSRFTASMSESRLSG